MLKGDANAVKAIVDRLFGSELLDSLNPEMNAIWEVYKNYINKDLKIKFEIPKGYENTGRFDGVYRHNENTIYINPNVFRALYNDVAKESKDGKVDILKVMDKFKTLMMEEVLHSIQVSHLQKGWNTPQGKSIREKYQKALTLGITNPYLQNTGNELVDVAEFIAGIYASPELRQDLEKADKGFIDRFLYSLKRLLQELIPGKGFETIHHNMIEMVKQNFGNVNFLESQQVAQEVKEVKKELSPSEKLNEIRKDEVQITPVKNEKGISTNPSEFINRSGGAKYEVNKNLANKDGSKRFAQNSGTITSKENPMQIYVDGSDIKGTGAIGYGAYAEYNNKTYELSGTNESDSVKELQKKFPQATFSNPTMEMLGLLETLKKFATTSEHIVINQDYKGAISYGELWNYSEGSEQRPDKPWNAKEAYIKDIVDQSVDIIKQIESNGGSVKINWVKGHQTGTSIHKKGNDNADRVAKDRNTKDTFDKFNNTDFESRDNFSNFAEEAFECK